MTGVQLYQWLRKSGTGENKLCHARAFLKDKPKATAADVIDEMLAVPERAKKPDGEADLTTTLFLRGLLQATVAKAREIVRLGHWDPAEFGQSAEPLDEFEKLLQAEPEPVTPQPVKATDKEPGIDHVHTPVRDRAKPQKPAAEASK